MGETDTEQQVAYLRMFSNIENSVETEYVALFLVSNDLVKSQICSLLYCSVITGGGKQHSRCFSGRRRGSPGAKSLYAKEQ